MKNSIIKNFKIIALYLFCISCSFASTSGSDPLSQFLGTFSDTLGGKWGMGFLLIAFTGSAITLAMVDEKVVWLRRLAWICAAGAMVVGAAKMLKLFGVDGAIF